MEWRGCCCRIVLSFCELILSGCFSSALSQSSLCSLVRSRFVQVGLAKLKIAEAWLNHNLRGASLLGCLDIADPSLLVFETAMGGHVLEVLDKLITRPKPVKLVLYDYEKGEAGRKVA